MLWKKQSEYPPNRKLKRLASRLQDVGSVLRDVRVSVRDAYVLKRNAQVFAQDAHIPNQDARSRFIYFELMATACISKRAPRNKGPEPMKARAGTSLPK